MGAAAEPTGDLHLGSFTDDGPWVVHPTARVHILAEIGQISMHFATTHGERLAPELGLDLSTCQWDLDGVQAGLGLEQGEATTDRDVNERRQLLRRRLRRKGR
jgi:hypothetical protein